MTSKTNKKIPEMTWSSIHSVLREIYESDADSAREYWHYTSVKGVLAIFDEYIKNSYKEKYVTKCSFLASNIRFMNDEQEYNAGVEAYRREAKLSELEPIKICDDIYLISFCGKGDLLSQWEWYGKDSGIAIKFNLPSVRYRTYSYVGSDGKEIPDLEYYDIQTKPLKVCYTKDAQSNLYRFLKNNSTIRTSKAEELFQAVFVPLCKHIGFEHEDESRLVFYETLLPSNDKIKSRFNIQYNSSDPHMVKPALKVEFSLNPECFDDKNLINEIIVGPGKNQELIFNLLIHVFDHKNYSYQNQLCKETVINMSEFVSSNEIGMRKVHYTDNIDREAYKCENGIVIAKSHLPFRG